MITVNPIYLNDIFTPLIGGADHEADITSFCRFDVNSKEDVIYLAKHYLIPAYRLQLPEIQLEIKRSLAFYLYYSKIDFESVYDSLLLPLETPTDTRLFFVWIWECFFPNESFDFIRNENVKEDFDVEAPLKLIGSIKGLSSNNEGFPSNRPENAMKINDFVIPLGAGIITEATYFVLPRIHTLLWLIFLLGFGIWLSVFLLKLCEHYTGMKFRNQILFFFIGIVIFGATILYASKNIELLLPFRRLTFLVFFVVLFLSNMALLLNLKVRFLDYLIGFFYAFVIAFLLSGREYWTIPRLDLLLSLLVTVFSFHSILISKRSTRPLTKKSFEYIQQ